MSKNVSTAPVQNFHFRVNFIRQFFLIFLLLAGFNASFRVALGLELPEPEFKHFLTEDGLSDNSINCIFQDRTGFLWVGTRNGLNRFDGYQFKIFRHDSTNPASISNNYIQCIFEDHLGILWMATWKGLNRFDPHTERFSCYQFQLGNPRSLSDNLINSITEDSTGMLWVGTDRGGLNYFNPQSGNAYHFRQRSTNPHGITSNIINEVFIDQNQQLWVGTYGGGLCRLNLRPLYSRIAAAGFVGIDSFVQNLSFTHFRHDPQNKHSLSRDFIGKIFQSRNGTIWLGTAAGGLNRFVPETDTFIRCQNSPRHQHNLVLDFVTTLHEDHLGHLWMGTWGSGVKIFDPEILQPMPRPDEIRPEQWVYDRARPRSLSHNQVSCIFEDRTGGVWIGTVAGLNLLVRNQPGFIHWQNRKNSSRGLNRIKVLSICEDRRGAIWLGTDNGLHRLAAASQITDQALSNHFYFVTDEKSNVTENFILSILEDARGQLWLATGNGLIKFDPATKLAEHFGATGTGISPKTETDNLPETEAAGPNLPPADALKITLLRRQPILDDRIVHCLLEDRRGILWLGTRKGLQRLDWQQNSFRSFGPEATDPHGLIGQSVRTLLEDQDGGIWVGTGKALNYLNRQTEKFTAFHPDGQNVSIVSLLQGVEGELWVGTSLGLLKFRRHENRFEWFIRDNRVQSLLEDALGNFWLGCNQGLIKLNPQTKSFKIYGLSAELPNICFMNNAAFKSRQSAYFLWGTMEGLVAFQPNLIHENNAPSPVVLTNFLIFNEPVKIGASPLTASITHTREMVLEHHQNVLSFEFAALDFTNPLKNQFAYRLAPAEWVEIGNRHFVDFGRLPPDKYELHVKGANSTGVWTDDGVQLKITIKPPWWRTWPAYLFYFLVAVGFLYTLRVVDRRRTHLKNELKLKQFQAEQLQEMDRMKSRFFANISHEFRTPMTLILGPLEKWFARMTDEEARRDFSIMRRNVQRLQRLINQLLDLSRLEARKMELRPTTLDLLRLVNRCFQSFESQAKIKAIQFHLESSEPQVLARIDPDKMENIIYNLLSNALKFTPIGGKVAVQLATVQNPAAVEIRVRDTGIGIPGEQLEQIFNRFYQVDDSFVRTHEGSGIGLSLAKELVELHGGSISVNSEPGVGSVFIVRLPVGKIDLTEMKPEVTPEIASEAAEPILGFAEPNAVPGGKPLVLIVEDNTDLRRFICEILRPNYLLLEAADGVEGLARAQAKVPDLIVSDVMMPRMDGFQLCEKLKTDEITSHIPVILLTARANRESKLAGLETGADDYLIKPFDAEELRVRIKNLITQRRQLRARFSQKLLIEPHEMAVTSADERFLQRALNLIEEKMADPDFNVEEFSRRIGLSRSQLHRKLDALTGQSATEFIRLIRLKRAASLIKQGYGNISEIAFEVGFNHLSYFTQCFRKEFGVNPKDYV
jgi:signal transduction histidine kinase/ligand-binding sensor domain-containing protein/DNA-binding response OmpR family regulator